MDWGLEAVHLKGHGVALRNFTREEIPSIAAAIDDPRGWFGVQWGLDRPEKIAPLLETHLASWAAGACNPIAYFVGNEVAGITRLHRIDAANRSLEIGGTWVAPRWRRTFVNTAVKRLLLKHCFEALGAHRVEFRVDARNAASQRAVLRLGAALEGRLRLRQIFPGGECRDGFLFSVVRTDWKRIDARLLGLLGEAPADARLAGTAFNYGAFLKSSGRQIGHLHVLNVDWGAPSGALAGPLGRFRRVAVRVLPDNEPSLRLAAALGFEREGLHRAEFVTDSGELADVVRFGLIRRVEPRPGLL